MGRLLLVVALGACGSVATAHFDGPPPDILPDALSCSDDQLACGSTCIDPMTDSTHCGTCDTACQAVGESCVAGHCVDMITSCSLIHQVNPAAVDGFYTLIDGTRVYCDMTDGATLTYEALEVGEFDIATAGYDLVSAADLQSAGLQSAFIALYNQQGGLNVIAPFTSGNCCFKADNAATSNMLLFGGSNIQPALAGTNVCNQVGGYVVASTYQFEITVGAVFATAPLASTFFTSHPVTAGSNCGPTMNPAFFWKRH